MKRETKRIVVALSLAIVIAFTAPVLAQEPEEPSAGCNPMAQWLAQRMGVECSELMARLGEGVGLGEMMMAHRLAAAFDSTLDRMMEAKQSGLGWGQIGHAHALAKAEIFTFEDTLDRLQGDPDWDELRADAGLSEGPPPWAGRPAWAGRPPWAGRGVDAETDDTDDDLGGPPPWAGGRFGLAGPGGGR